MGNGQEYDETGDPNDVRDRKGHGTAVTSFILGTDKMAGIAPDVKVDEYRVFSNQTSLTPWVLKALVTAANNGDDIINMSLGKYGLLSGGYFNGMGNNDAAEFQALTRAVQYAESKGSVVVVSSGNDGLDLSNPYEIVNYINYKNPEARAQGEGVAMMAGLPGIIQVGATGADDNRAEYSCYSPVTFYAPGGDTLRTGSPDRGYFDINLVPSEWVMYYGGEGDKYNFGTGTSFSAPEVSGMLAHLIVNNNLQKQPEKIKAKLKEVAVNKNNLNQITLDSILEHKTKPEGPKDSSHKSSSSTPSAPSSRVNSSHTSTSSSRSAA